MKNLTWEDPPHVQTAQPPRKPSKHVRFAKVLRDNPGKWARIIESSDRSRLYALRKGATAAYPVGEFEFEFRSDSAQGYDRGWMYARFIGKP